MTHYKISVEFQVDIKNLPPDMKEKLTEILEEIKSTQTNKKNKKMHIAVEKVKDD